jgi:hypothetical protein
MDNSQLLIRLFLSALLYALVFMEILLDFVYI